jgi:hypothetical protein
VLVPAQIELGKKMVPRVSYMSTHMGFDSMSPEVRALVQKLSKEYRLAMSGAELGTQSMGRNVAFDRSGVVAAWSDPKVIAAVKKYGIKLTSYRELLTKQ